jgi:gamma-glutamylcyclotransferase (GGCT)/AIG2-like uncharacterized protein YtfP
VGLRRANAGSAPLFVYGTLQFPEVLTELIGRCPQLDPASVLGWRVAALPGRVYPGLVPDSGGLARGVLLSGLTAAEWEVLDEFEDVEYELRQVPVVDRVESVSTYVWTAEVEPGNWQADRFAIDHLAGFAARCARWRSGASADLTSSSWGSARLG